MPGKSSNLGQFWQELKRRKVVRVITVYAAVSFVILEVTDIVAPSLGLPDWTLNLIIILLCAGFFITVILSWVYDITPEGIEKTKPINEASDAISDGPGGINAWKIATFISVVIIVGLVIFHKVGERNNEKNIRELEKSIAVLAFEDMSPEKDQEYFCDGISEEIINALTHIEGLKVIARTSAFAFKGKNEDIREIGNKLDVGTILEGSVRKDGNRLRITAQLVVVEDGSHLWSERYDRDMEGIFDIQDEISLAIAKNLKIKLLGEEKAVVVKRYTKNLEAYEYYLRGNEYYWRSYEQQDFRLAIKMFQKAIELDPNFALAHTRLAESQLFIYWHHVDRSEDRLMKSKKAIDNAFKIEPDLTEAHIALGIYYYWGLLDYSNALEQFDIALKQSPKNPECPFWIAAVHRRAGNIEKAKESFIKAFELDPRSSRKAQSVAQTHALLREYSEAIHYYDIAASLRPDWIAPYYLRAFIDVNLNRNTTNARILLKEINQLSTSTDEQTSLRNTWIRIELYDGNYEEALRYLFLERSEAFKSQFNFIPRYQYFAMIYGLIDDPKLEYAYYDSSRLMLEEKLIGAPFDSRLYSSLGIAYAGLGRMKEAINMGKKAVELLPIEKEAFRGTYRLEDLARIYVMAGEHEKALEVIDLLLSIPGMLSTILLQLDPVWIPLENNPEFTRLLETYSENQETR